MSFIINPYSFGGVSYDADAQAFFNRVTAAGGTLSTTEKNATNQLVLDLKSNGLWTNMLAIYPMVGASSAACSQNLKSSSFTGTFNGGWTFASTGATPNATNANMNTFLAPNGNLLQDSTQISYYSRSNTSGLISVEMGSGTPNPLFIAPQYNLSLQCFRAVNSAQLGPDTGFINTAALFQANRINSTTSILYRNSTAIFTDASASTGLSTASIYVGAGNGASALSGRQCAYASIGLGMTPTEQSNHYTAVQAFNTTLSRQV